MAMMKFDLDAELDKTFQAERADGTLRWIKIGIKDEKIVKLSEGKQSDDPSKDVATLQASIDDPKQPFFAAVRYDGEGHWVLLSYIPDDSVVKVRMLYAGSELHVKKTLGSAIVATSKATEKSEVSWEEVQAVGKKALGGKGDPQLDLMTPAERERHETTKEHQASITGSAGAAYTHGVKFPLQDEAKEALEAFGKGDLSAVSFYVDGKPETIAADKATQVKEKGATIEDVVKTVNEKGESRYILYRFTREVDGDEKTDVLFIYFCSSGTPVKKRMIYASGKAVAIHYATEAGAAPAKCLEYTDLEDATSKALEESLRPATAEEAEEEKVTKPKPMPKGPRMLI
eukprot:Hpha_TRINITY_DN22744_c0_g1::TRINITY_DN22744_c0_g1_i1::g.34253::m.34253/K08870/TWF; twinfilin